MDANDKELVLKNIESLIQYGLQNMLFGDADIYQIRNELLHILKIDESLVDAEIIKQNSFELYSILQAITNIAVKYEIIKDNIGERDNFDTRIMGILMPRQSEVISIFNKYLKRSSVDATNYLYSLCIASNYLRLDRLAKNIVWNHEKLQITINLAKPEIDPLTIKNTAITAIKTTYPKCALCVENIGYFGRANYPARQNLRAIPIKLGNDNFYFQYSPYSYFNEHCIVLSEEHKPMKTDFNTFMNMIHFVDIFPHYFLGSNAGLPIVGGSILAHDHFQGGSANLPIFNAAFSEIYNSDSIIIEKIEWYMTCFRIIGKNKESVVNAADHIRNVWEEYEDNEIGILAYSIENGVRTQHNAVTTIVRKVDNQYQIYIILRNNRTNIENPYGIFHPGEELHHIKKENIGVIEAVGLAILPGRLFKELELIKGLLCGSTDLDIINTSILSKHKPWINSLLEKYKHTLSESEAEIVIKKEVFTKFEKILSSCNVFKEDISNRSFNRFKEQLTNGII